MNGNQNPPYWYPEMSDLGLRTLHALRDYVVTDQAMRKAAGKLMGLNVTDMTALRRIIAAERSGQPLNPSELSQALGLSTASITKTVDKLVQHGYAERISDPHDRRGLRIVSTERAHSDVRDEMAILHQEMARIITERSEEELALISEFLLRQNAVLQQFIRESEEHSDGSSGVEKNQQGQKPENGNK